MQTAEDDQDGNGDEEFSLSTAGDTGTTPQAQEDDILNAIESISEESRVTFVEAWENHRDLVRRETPFWRFLKTEEGNTDLAAMRLAGYWENRKNLFEERVFYPMILDKQQERGALAYEDIEILETGFNTFLPEREDGGPVLFYDLARLEKEMMAGKGKHRCNFYLLHLACEDPRAQTVGVTMVRYTVGTAFHLDMKPFMAFLRTMPCIMHSIERVIYHPLGAKGMVEQTIVPLKKRTIPEVYKRILRMHTSDSHQEIGASLCRVGFSLSGLPDFLGGTRKYEDLIRFDLTSRPAIAQQDQQRQEEEADRKRPAETTAQQLTPKHSRTNSHPESPSIAEKSRKQRLKEKMNLVALKKEVADLQSEKRHLQQEGSYLEGLMTAANAEVNKSLQMQTPPIGQMYNIGLPQAPPVLSSVQPLSRSDPFMSHAAANANDNVLLQHLLRPSSHGAVSGQQGVNRAQRQGQVFTSDPQYQAFDPDTRIRHGFLQMNSIHPSFLANPTRQCTNVHTLEGPAQRGSSMVGSVNPVILSRLLRASNSATSRQFQPAANLDPRVFALLTEMQRRDTGP